MPVNNPNKAKGPSFEEVLARQEKRSRTRRAAAAGALALYGIVMPGGATDQVLDSRLNGGDKARVKAESNALDTLESSINSDGETGWLHDDPNFAHLHGKSKEEIAPYEPQIVEVEPFIGDILEQERTSMDSIAQSLDDLDHGNHAAIRQRAETDRLTHPEQYPLDEIYESTVESIDNADSIDEVSEALNGALARVDVQAVVITDEAAGLDYDMDPVSPSGISDLKEYSKAILNIHNTLPQQVLMGFGSRKFVLGSDFKDDVGTLGEASFDTIKLDVHHGLLMDTAGKALNKPEELLGGAGISPTDTTLHEMGHLHNGTYGSSYRVPGDETGRHFLKHLPGVALGIREQTSVYAIMGGRENDTDISDSDESRAELFRDVLDGKIIHPDRVIGFERSGLANDQLSIMRALEEDYPGVMDQIFANTVAAEDMTHYDRVATNERQIIVGLLAFIAARNARRKGRG